MTETYLLYFSWPVIPAAAPRVSLPLRSNSSVESGTSWVPLLRSRPMVSKEVRLRRSSLTLKAPLESLTKG
ncbi:hypothetical protein D3C86_1882650 [compost metagenome]